MKTNTTEKNAMQTAVTLHGLGNNKLRSFEVVVFSAPYRHNLFKTFSNHRWLTIMMKNPGKANKLHNQGIKTTLVSKA